MLSVVSTRYARALVDVVTAPGSNIDPVQVLSQLRAVQDLIHGSDILQHALASPAVAPSRKRAVMRRLMEPLGVVDKVRNFVYVVIDHRRGHEFASIVDAFEAVLDERLGFVAAEVRSATALTDGQRAQLEAQVSRLAGKKAKLKFSSDPALIGGVVARVGSTVYDGSVRGQLERLRTRLGAG
ncbi:MAG: synthase delta subunit [Bryobacterales bacterium]|nr:synthase delta subunit [Bryobacterales bacterium]